MHTGTPIASTSSHPTASMIMSPHPTASMSPHPIEPQPNPPVPIAAALIIQSRPTLTSIIYVAENGRESEHQFLYTNLHPTPVRAPNPGKNVGNPLYLVFFM